MNINNLKFLAKPIVALVVVLLGTIVVISFGLSRINKIRDQIKETTHAKNVLNKKVQVLGQIDSLVPSGLEFINIALPDKNAIIYGIYQIKTLSAQRSLLLSNIRSGGSFDAKSVSKLGLSFEITGDQSNVYNFIDAIQKVLPLMTVSKVKISSELGLVKANVSLNVYSSELPKKLPSVTSVISEFTPEEVTLLNELALYNLPDFYNLQPTIPENITGSDLEGQIRREDPFN